MFVQASIYSLLYQQTYSIYYRQAVQANFLLFPPFYIIVPLYLSTYNPACKNATFSDTLALLFLYYVNALGLRRTKPFHMFSTIVHSHNHMLTPLISLSITCYFHLIPLFPRLWHYPDKEAIVFRPIMFILYCRKDKAKEDKEICTALFISYCFYCLRCWFQINNVMVFCTELRLSIKDLEIPLLKEQTFQTHLHPQLHLQPLHFYFYSYFS